ncbi:FAD binding domain-containing protein [Portibacter marinus]|uniref:FAD binding domain-containing protein n=1 Tax=Portibacter marinus TaxID=2898660 RepID=UPI001F417E30|nr:xanthine dehydrogenase family protein subunit M [Portibacter marinus]
MIPAQFEYKSASSVQEALSMLGENDKILGGGHSLIPAMKLRLNMPEALIDISKIEKLKEITDNEATITIGAGATHASIAAHKALKNHAPMIAEAAGMIGDIQVRNRGTIGGSIAHADPSADWPAVLLAADAKIVIANATGSREVDVDQFFQGFYTTALEDNEIITAIRIPKSAANANSCYEKFVQPASRFAIVGCAAAVEKNGDSVSSARIAFSGVSDAPYRAKEVETALKGGDLSEEHLDMACAGVTSDVSVMSDHFASEKYRAHLATVYAKRALRRL